MDRVSPNTPPLTIGKNQDLSTWPELPPTITDPSTGRRFKIGKFLGKGGFAKCYQCTDLSTGQMYCCKAIYDPKSACQAQQIQMESEKNILQKLNHPNIMGLKMRFIASGFLCLILELCPHGTLLSLLKQRKRLTETEARILAANFASALVHLKEQGILHRDLKLANLLLADGPSGGMVLKLGDFGLAIQFKTQTDERRWTFCGTPNFIAPEVVDSQSTEGYGFAADVWSLGVVIYTMLLGSLPFAASSREVLFSKIQACNIQFPADRPISSKAKDLIRSILKKDPSSRLSIDKIISHPFFASGPTSLPLISLSRKPTLQEMSTPTRKPLTVASNVDSRVLKPTHSSPLPVTNNKRKRIPLRELGMNSRPSNDRDLSRPLLRVASANAGVSNRFSSGSQDLEKLSKPGLVDLPKSPLKRIASKPWLADFATAIELELTCTESPPEHHPPRPNEELNYVVRSMDNDKICGVGFGMKDGSAGVLFKDATSIVYRPGQSHYEYRNTDLVSTQLDPQHLSPDLQPKANILSKLRPYMTSGVAPVLNDSPQISPSVVTRFGKTHQATLFTLSSQAFQVNFKDDHVKVIVSDKGKFFTIVLPNRSPLTYPLGTGILRYFPPPGLKETPDRLLYILKLVRRVLNKETSSII